MRNQEGKRIAYELRCEIAAYGSHTAAQWAEILANKRGKLFIRPYERTNRNA